MGTAGKLTIEENLSLAVLRWQPRGLKKACNKKRRELFREALAQLELGLEDRLTVPVGTLSGGQRQALALVMITISKPALLLLDEPSAGLSPANQDLVFDRVRSIADRSVSILMVEQNARRCLQIADRAYVLDQGKNAYTGPGRELLQDSKVIDLYLGTLGKAK